MLNATYHTPAALPIDTRTRCHPFLRLLWLPDRARVTVRSEIPGDGATRSEWLLYLVLVLVARVVENFGMDMGEAWWRGMHVDQVLIRLLCLDLLLRFKVWFLQVWCGMYFLWTYFLGRTFT